MSVVTSLILTFDIIEDEDARMAEVNTFAFRHGVGMKDIGEGFGGTKVAQIPVWAGAFNHLDLAASVAHLRTVGWEYPGNVRLLINEEWDDGVRLESLDSFTGREPNGDVEVEAEKWGAVAHDAEAQLAACREALREILERPHGEIDEHDMRSIAHRALSDGGSET